MHEVSDRTTRALAAMNKILFILFLAVSLAAQIPSISAQIDNEHRVTRTSHAGASGQRYDTDFDDEQRGAKAFAPLVPDLPVSCATVHEPAHAHHTHLDFSFVCVPLFKLHAVLLI
jgi:hypothetical protein